MLMWLAIIITLPAAAFALSLVSEMFAYSVSRWVEAAFEGVEYRIALRARARRDSRAEPAAGRRRGETATAFAASVTRAA